LKSNIFNQINSTISKMKSGDSLIFHLSGHGGQIADLNKDETDKLDETVYVENLTPITDDELKANLINKIPKKCKLRCFIDTCHSGSSLDLPFCIKTTNNTYTSESASCLLSSDVLCISGCKDNQYSADTVIDDKPAGALTGYLLKSFALASNNETWFELLISVRSMLKTNNYPQIPQLSIGYKGLENTILDI